MELVHCKELLQETLHGSGEKYQIGQSKHNLPQISFETAGEWNFVRYIMARAGKTEIWTAGRLCDAEVSWNMRYIVSFLEHEINCQFLGTEAFEQRNHDKKNRIWNELFL